MEFGKSELALELFEALSKVHDRMYKMQLRQSFRNSMTYPQVEVLKIVFKTGPISLKRISEEMMVTQANITVLVANLVKKGLVTRDRSKDDGRSFLVSLTPEGVLRVKDMIEKYSNKMDSVVSFLDSQEQDALLGILNKMNMV